eukprot:scaffold87706_cov72-Attheya_sp.AAC.3
MLRNNNEKVADCMGNAILIHGQQDKKENCFNKKVFLGQVTNSSLMSAILVAMSAANCSIDNS